MNTMQIFMQIMIVCDSIIKIIFNILGIKRILKINSNMKVDDKYLSYSNINIDNSI